jgi:hypothetical protein
MPRDFRLLSGTLVPHLHAARGHGGYWPGHPDSAPPSEEVFAAKPSAGLRGGGGVGEGGARTAMGDLKKL